MWISHNIPICLKNFSILINSRIAINFEEKTLKELNHLITHIVIHIRPQNEFKGRLSIRRSGFVLIRVNLIRQKNKLRKETVYKV